MFFYCFLFANLATDNDALTMIDDISWILRLAGKLIPSHPYELQSNVLADIDPALIDHQKILPFIF